MNTSTHSPPLCIPANPEAQIHTVLLLDNCGAFCNLVWGQLTALGYHVLTASTGPEAQDMLLGHGPENIDLLIADQDMHLTRGNELAETFQRAKPGAKVLLMSSQPNTAKLGKNTGFLQKPLRIETLGEQVRTFLESDAKVPQKKAA